MVQLNRIHLFIPPTSRSSTYSIYFRFSH
uniref:Uncharacterized protein n=1 Tax=Anguilla anguilla TaxID=7936 RepID=A0A0E9PWR9_ANGAN